MLRLVDLGNIVYAELNSYIKSHYDVHVRDTLYRQFMKTKDNLHSTNDAIVTTRDYKIHTTISDVERTLSVYQILKNRANEHPIMDPDNVRLLLHKIRRDAVLDSVLSQIISIAPNPIGYITENNFIYGPAPEYLTFRTDFKFIEVDDVLYSHQTHQSISPSTYMHNVKNAIEESFTFPLPQLLIQITGQLTIHPDPKSKTFTIQGWRQPSPDAYEIYRTIATRTMMMAHEIGIREYMDMEQFEEEFPIRLILSPSTYNNPPVTLSDRFAERKCNRTSQIRRIHNLIDCFSAGHKLLTYISETSKKRRSINKPTLQLLQEQYEEEMDSFLQFIETYNVA